MLFYFEFILPDMFKMAAFQKIYIHRYISFLVIYTLLACAKQASHTHTHTHIVAAD